MEEGSHCLCHFWITMYLPVDRYILRIGTPSRTAIAVLLRRAFLAIASAGREVDECNPLARHVRRAYIATAFLDIVRS